MKVSFIGTYHWGQWTQVPPSSPPGQWEWTLGWAGPCLSWCPPTDKGWAQRHPCGHRTLRTAVWWSPLWCPGRCWTRWSCVNGWRSFHDSLWQHPAQHRSTHRRRGERHEVVARERGARKKKKQEQGRVFRCRRRNVEEKEDRTVVWEDKQLKRKKVHSKEKESEWSHVF